MRIKSISIENFKAFKRVKLNCNEKINFLVGENNIGKSSILEAIQLWKVGYDCLVTNNNRNFYGKNTPRYLPFESLFFLRIGAVNDLFFDSSKKKVSITLEVSEGEESYSLKITLEKPSMIDTYLRVKFQDVAFNRFKEKVLEIGLNLCTVIFIYQTRPVFYSIKNEPFYNNAQLLKKITLGKSSDVIRNKILKCEKTETGFQTLEERMNNVFNTGIKIRLKNRSKQDEEYVRITIQETGKKEIDIGMVGSGLLQVLEIFSTLQFINKFHNGLNILLIDEPDSHIHSNLQSVLIDELRKDEGNQIFIISHNDRLIRKAGENELFYINKTSLELGQIDALPEDSYDTISIELAGQLLGLDENAKSKIIVITEGKTDKKLLDIAWNKLNPSVECPFLFISSGLELDEDTRTGNADTVRRTIELVSTISEDIKLVGLFDNDREGNEQFKSVSKKIFEEYSVESRVRKHLTKNIFAMLLPIPPSRELFVTANDILQRYLAIEHLFTDELLEREKMKGPNILSTSVFTIIGDKNSFAERAERFDSNEFEGFNYLFNELKTSFTPSTD